MTATSWQSLAHSRWECKYHVVFIPQYRRKAIDGELRASLGAIFPELARQKECRIVEGIYWRTMSTCVSRSRLSMR